MNLFVCECTLFENPRMSSIYLMLAKNKRVLSAPRPAQLEAEQQRVAR
jgi:hypothetical protein